MSNKETTQKTIIVALVLCVVCSVIVSTAAVVLRPAQKANKERDFQKNVLMAADLYDASMSVKEQFKRVEIKVVDLSSGKFTDAVDSDKYDQAKAAKDPKLSKALDDEKDIAGLSRLEDYSKVYIISNDQGLDKIILPIRGYGLWSTLKGFVALQSDLNTVVGLGYYDQKETPGLGGEVDNPKWKALWGGKKVYSDGEVALSVIKGTVSDTTPGAQYKVDGLSGATLTSDGVDNMIKFWLGENGFAPFLANLKKGAA